jgi:hypothetical protein
MTGVSDRLANAYLPTRSCLLKSKKAHTMSNETYSIPRIRAQLAKAGVSQLQTHSSAHAIKTAFKV